MRRTLLSLFSLLAMASILLASACSPAKSPAGKAQSTPTPIPLPQQASKPTFKVERGDVTEQVQFSARVMPAVQEELYFRSDGRVRKVYVRSGDAVTRGQVLADLVSLDDMEAQKKQQDLNLRRSQINVEMAWLRQQEWATRTPNWSTTYDIDAKMQQYELELAQIALEETQLKSQNLDGAIADAQIISPVDGKALSVQLLEGADVRAFNVCVTVGDDSTLEVGATLTTTQMENLAEGMPAQLEFSDKPGEKLEGKVRVLPYPYGSGGKTTKEAKSTTTAADQTARVSLNDPNALKGHRLGDLVNVTVILKSKQNALWLPPQAVRTFEGRNFVVIQTGTQPKRVDVKVGIKNADQVEIVSGVQEGDVIIAP